MVSLNEIIISNLYINTYFIILSSTLCTISSDINKSEAQGIIFYLCFQSDKIEPLKLSSTFYSTFIHLFSIASPDFKHYKLKRGGKC